MGVSKKVLADILKVPEERIICENCWSYSVKYCTFWKTEVEDEKTEYCSFFEDKEKE